MTQIPNVASSARDNYPLRAMNGLRGSNGSSSNGEVKYPANCATRLTVETNHVDASAINVQNSNLEKLYETKPNKKIVRIITVIAYVFSVSMIAILLSLYYLFLWDPYLKHHEKNLQSGEDLQYGEKVGPRQHMALIDPVQEALGLQGFQGHAQDPRNGLQGYQGQDIRDQPQLQERQETVPRALALTPLAGVALDEGGRGLHSSTKNLETLMMKALKKIEEKRPKILSSS